MASSSVGELRCRRGGVVSSIRAAGEGTDPGSASVPRRPGRGTRRASASGPCRPRRRADPADPGGPTPRDEPTPGEGIAGPAPRRAGSGGARVRGAVQVLSHGRDGALDACGLGRAEPGAAASRRSVGRATPGPGPGPGQETVHRGGRRGSRAIAHLSPLFAGVQTGGPGTR